MRIEDIEVKKDGSVTISSIFEFESSIDVTMLVGKCLSDDCILRFENEDLTIDSSYIRDPGKSAMVTLYSLLVAHPKAAQDYYNYLFKKANKETPGD